MNTQKKLIGVMMILILIISGCSAPQEKQQPTDTNNQEKQTTQTQELSQEEAIAIALKRANFVKEDVNALRAKSDTEDGIPVYDVEFIANGTEYKYEIKREDGAILKEESKLQQPHSNSGNQQIETSISIEQAKQMVLEKVPGSTNNDLSIHSDYEDGVPTFEGTLYYQGMEYEFEINANNGAMMKWSEEAWD